MHRNSFRGISFFFIICAICAICGSPLFAEDRALELFSASPAAFIENTGQIADPAVRYVFHGSGASVYHTTSGPVFQVFQQMDRMDGSRSSAPTSHQALTFSAGFPGACTTEPEGADLQQSMVNYYIGDPSGWRANVPTFAKVVYRGLYEGIDLHTFGRRSSLKYEFHVSPGAKWRQIKVRYFGIDGLRIDSAGAMHVSTALGELVDDAPYAYQIIDGKEVRVACRYRLIDRMTYGFEVTDEVDERRELVIDPDLAWASFLGGSGNEYGSGIAADADGNALIAGGTSSVDFPISGGIDTGYNGGHYDAFIAKVSASGQLLWSSFVGGNGYDKSNGIAVCPSGVSLITGYTDSSDFPTPNGFDRSLSGTNDAFVAAISETGTLIWASYLGGSSYDLGAGIAAGADSSAIVTGNSWSSDFPVPNGFDTSLGGNEDAFMVRISSSGQLLWGSFLGGSLNDKGYGVARDGAGDVLMSGWTISPDFPTPNGFDTTYGGNHDAFVAKVSSSGQLLWASYLGGSYSDYWGNNHITVDADENALVVGTTQSLDFPIAGPYGHDFGGGDFDAFVTKVGPTGKLIWSRYLGSSGWDNGFGIAAADDCRIIVTGEAGAPDFALEAGLPLVHHGGQYDVFVAELAADGEVLSVALIGGSRSEGGSGLSVIRDGQLWVAGYTGSPDFPTPNGFDMAIGGEQDAFIAKFSLITRTLNVFSNPITGISITGSKPGTTNYTAMCNDQEIVELSAPPSAEASGIDYRFSHWMLDGVAQPLGQKTLRITMDADRTAISVWKLAGDVNADCAVNVLDLLLVRNKLLVYEPDNPDYIRADVNGDGQVSILDLIFTRNRLGRRCP